MELAKRNGYWCHIALNIKHGTAQKLGTLVHELGHVFCGHLGEVENGFWIDRSHAKPAARELEAEAVAYLVMQRYNVDIGSAKYLAGHLGNDALLPQYSLDSILKAAGKVEEMIDGRFRMKRKAPSSASPGAATVPRPNLQPVIGELGLSLQRSTRRTKP